MSVLVSPKVSLLDLTLFAKLIFPPDKNNKAIPVKYYL